MSEYFCFKKHFIKEQKEEHFRLGLDTKTTLHDLVKDWKEHPERMLVLEFLYREPDNYLWMPSCVKLGAIYLACGQVNTSRRKLNG